MYYIDTACPDWLMQQRKRGLGRSVSKHFASTSIKEPSEKKKRKSRPAYIFGVGLKRVQRTH